MPWLLWKFGSSLLPNWLASEWRGHARTTRAAGRAAWSATTLFALHTLRWAEQGCSRLGACRRAKTDLTWRAAMGLDVGTGTPTESTMREFEAWLRDRARSCDVPRYLLLHEHLARCALRRAPTSGPVAMDSTPMWCFGALRGTVRLLGSGLRGLGRRLARRLKIPLRELALRWTAPWLATRSMKGGLPSIDWRSKTARAQGMDGIVKTVLAAVEDAKELIRRLPERDRGALVARCRDLLKVVADDLEEDAEGRLVIARKVAADRIVSITDPEARSGRKTRSQPFKGYRLHVLGDVASGVVLAVDVVAANTHDARVGEALVDRARRLLPQLDQVLADTAYGATAVRTRLAGLGVDLVAPPQMPSKKSTKTLRKQEFHIDFDALVATCPEGVESADHTARRTEAGEILRFSWPRRVCAACPLRERCTPRTPVADAPTPPQGRPPRKGKSLTLHPQERELRAARLRWATPARKALYKRRAEVELLIAHSVRAGGRQARQWGLAAAQLQAHSIAMRLNLSVIAREMTRK